MPGRLLWLSPKTSSAEMHRVIWVQPVTFDSVMKLGRFLEWQQTSNGNQSKKEALYESQENCDPGPFHP
jgi:hypothetical protein